MAKISIDRIQKFLREHGETGSTPFHNDGDSFFLEICFEKEGRIQKVVDDDYKDAVLTVESDYGSVLILFNEFGYLKSIEIA